MRIVVCDYSGHPFQIQLSRVLAKRGHQILHLSFAGFQTPKGNLDLSPLESANLTIKALSLRTEFKKHSFFRRRRQEKEIGQAFAREISHFGPDVVISSNSPLDTQYFIQSATLQCNAKFVFWLQDLYGEAIDRILSAKLGFFGHAVGLFYRSLEKKLLRNSHFVVTISNDFKHILERLGIVHCAVIENWAPIEEIPRQSRDNEWASTHLPESSCRFIYTGTLGQKHNPTLLLELAKAAVGEVVVYSEGPVAERLALSASRQNVKNLHVRNWLPFATIPEALGGADVLVVLLEEDAGVFAVPSKVLTYLCAGRPILGAMPANNLASRIVTDNSAGIVVDPSRSDAFAAAASNLAAAPTLREEMGVSARQYAEQTFDIDLITSKFEQIFFDIKRDALA